MFIDLAYYAGCLGVVGVRGGVLVLEWDGACTDRAYIDRAYSCLLLEFPQELNFFIVRIWCLILISYRVHLCFFFALRTCS